jgi:hypothetical protein
MLQLGFGRVVTRCVPGYRHVFYVTISRSHRKKATLIHTFLSHHSLLQPQIF